MKKHLQILLNGIIPFGKVLLVMFGVALLAYYLNEYVFLSLVALYVIYVLGKINSND
jgi:hypothetical protein